MTFTFESLSKTAWILPGPALFALPIVVALSFRARGFYRAWGLFFGVSTALDALLNGAWTPFAPNSGWATLSGIAFVYLGDLRLFTAVLWNGSKRSLLKAASLAWVVPLLTQAFRALFPSLALVPRTTFLLYEVLFVVFLGGIFAATRALSKLELPNPEGRKNLAIFFVAQYMLWISADVVLLQTSSDFGYAVRIVPDVLYYGVFVCFTLISLSRRAQ
jgi:hypothetical protein